MSGAHRTRAVLAQNFFASAAPARTLVRQAGVAPGNLVYDLGAGTGLITTALLAAGARVVAVERDPNLAGKLRDRFATAPAVTVLEADLAEVRFRAPFSVVANPPFNCTAALLRRLLFEPPSPESTTLVLQRDAARKWAGVPRATTVSLTAAPWFELSVTEPFRRRDFTPAPGVDVAVLSIAKRAAPRLDEDQQVAWTAFVRHVFGRGRADARGALRNLLSHLQWRRLSADLGFTPVARLAELSCDDWLAVYRFAMAHASPAKLRRLEQPQPSASPASQRPSASTLAWKRSPMRR